MTDDFRQHLRVSLDHDGYGEGPPIGERRAFKKGPNSALLQKPAHRAKHRFCFTGGAGSRPRPDTDGK